MGSCASRSESRTRRISWPTSSTPSRPDGGTGSLGLRSSRFGRARATHRQDRRGVGGRFADGGGGVVLGDDLLEQLRGYVEEKAARSSRDHLAPKHARSGARQHEVLLGPGHADVEQATLFLDVGGAGV